MTYHAQYSTTEGDMWVDAGWHDSLKAARTALRGFAKAGNPCRVIEIDDDAPTDSMSNLLVAGQARII